MRVGRIVRTRVSLYVLAFLRWCLASVLVTLFACLFEPTSVLTLSINDSNLVFNLFPFFRYWFSTFMLSIDSLSIIYFWKRFFLNLINNMFYSIFCLLVFDVFSGSYASSSLVLQHLVNLVFPKFSFLILTKNLHDNYFYIIYTFLFYLIFDGVNILWKLFVWFCVSGWIALHVVSICLLVYY